MLENMRTALTDRLIRKIAWNMPYHTEHHSYPAVPFHHLPALHSLMADRLQPVEPGYGAFHRRYFSTLVSR
jgi:fatty acid desaturase